MAKQLAHYVFGREDAIVRIDMSEYTEKHTISRLVGSPPGYVGYNEGGLLTEPVRKKPYSIVLFDEIEKAHPEVNNLLLQVMEDGRLTDSTGKMVDFKNTIIIMTSNVGAKTIESNQGIGFNTKTDEKEDYSRMKEKILAEVKESFSPEFINRIDDIIIFKALSKEHLREIMDLFIGDVNQRIKSRDITIKLNITAKNWIIDKGYQANKGARPLRKMIQDSIEDAIAHMIIDRKIPDHSVVNVGVKADELSFIPSPKEVKD
jgi:ATP-dependent Clp protease ATP-binding subunit ClpC